VDSIEGWVATATTTTRTTKRC